jgi:hypothetical protein
MVSAIAPDVENLAAVCRKYGVLRLSVFGSAARGELTPNSDIDLLVEFNSECRPGLVGMYELEQELSALFGGRKIDLVNAKYLNRHIRDRVLAEAEVQFAEG